ncbi:MAG TPA: hypothetical protein VHM26_09420 [Chitinophagaceae bacterium]|nr:hypothetical protein [Chitinophagaceae bacterium]
MIIGIVLAIVLVRNRHFNFYAERNANTIVENLETGKIGVEAAAAALDILVARKSVDTSTLNSFIKKLATTDLTANLPSQYTIRLKKEGSLHTIIIIASAIFKEMVYISNPPKVTGVYYNCWLYIVREQSGSCIDFYSSLPVDNEHKELLDRFVQHIFYIGSRP